MCLPRPARPGVGRRQETNTMQVCMGWGAGEACLCLSFSVCSLFSSSCQSLSLDAKRHGQESLFLSETGKMFSFCQWRRRIFKLFSRLPYLPLESIVLDISYLIYRISLFHLNCPLFLFKKKLEDLKWQVIWRNAFPQRKVSLYGHAFSPSEPARLQSVRLSASHACLSSGPSPVLQSQIQVKGAAVACGVPAGHILAIGKGRRHNGRMPNVSG